MKVLHVLDVGLALDYVCRQIKSHHPEFKCVKLRIPYKSCSTKDQMLFYYDQLKNYENLVTACVTCISIIKDFRIPNAVIPVCECIRKNKFSNVIILSTDMTSRIRIHEQILEQYIRYVKMDDLLHCIENKVSLKKPLERLSNFKYLLRKADCIILGCSHFCIYEVSIREKLTEYGFEGYLINSVDEFIKYI